MDHMDSLFQDCTTHIVNFCCHIEHIYVYVFVCFVFVIYYDLQVHFHVTGQINIHFNTSVMDRHCSDRCLHHHPYKKKICIEGLKGLCPHHFPTLVSHGQISRYFCIWGVIAFPERKQRSGHVRLKLVWLTAWLAVWVQYFQAFITDFHLLGVLMQILITMMVIYD